MQIAIIGDYNASFRPHLATNEAIAHGLPHLAHQIDYNWISTDRIDHEFDDIIRRYQGFWIAPGSPYHSMAGALRIIEHARKNNIPTLGTCGGFQHMVIEFARNVMGIADAEHAEYDPYASKLVVNPLSCSLAGQTLQIDLPIENSLTRKIYGTGQINEKYYCNFGLNPDYQQQLHDLGFRITGTDKHQEARILELRDHPFFIATLFVPQDNSTAAKPHPLVLAFLNSISGK